jgi:hypothetical protein
MKIHSTAADGVPPPQVKRGVVELYWAVTEEVLFREGPTPRAPKSKPVSSPPTAAGQFLLASIWRAGQARGEAKDGECHGGMAKEDNLSRHARIVSPADKPSNCVPRCIPK